jgi:hypothetical protein
VGNYFRPRATLSLLSCLAGHIKAIKAISMLQKLVLAGRMLPPPDFRPNFVFFYDHIYFIGLSSSLISSSFI